MRVTILRKWKHDKSRSHRNIDPRIDTYRRVKTGFKKSNRDFHLHDIMSAILISQNNKMAAMLVAETSPARVELFPYENANFHRKVFA